MLLQVRRQNSKASNENQNEGQNAECQTRVEDIASQRDDLESVVTQTAPSSIEITVPEVASNSYYFHER